MDKLHIPQSTMRNLILPLLAAGSIAGVADAASGVRVHRLGEPPLPPRSVDTRSAASYRYQPAPPSRLARALPTPTVPASAQQQAAGRRLPLAPQGFAPKAAPAVVPTVLPNAPAAATRQPQSAPRAYVPAPVPTATREDRPRSRYAPVVAPVVAPAPAMAAPQPAAVAPPPPAPAPPPILPAAPKPAPRAIQQPTAPAVAPAPIPAPAPAAAPAPAPAPRQAPARPRRRLPIAPIVVADGSTDLPPVPAELLRH